MTQPRIPEGKKVRYAVVGSGWFAQAAILPAFANASENSELVAVVSGDPVKRDELSQQYKVPAYDYPQYDELCASGKVDAVYIALPNSHHREYTERAARAGVHVLSEKPMAPTEADCRAMIQACDDNGVKLMVAYRLHFEEGHLTASEYVNTGKIGEPRVFTSVFSQQVQEGNSRLSEDLAGGPVLDIGIYCINASRYMFRDDPLEVSAFAASNGETRFSEVPEAVSVVMRFPKGRLAQFVCSFGAGKASFFRVVGATGDLHAEPAYPWNEAIKFTLTQQGASKNYSFKARDQVAAEIIYFSGCLMKNQQPEPDGWEGLADVRIIEAVHRSMETGKAVVLDPFKPKPRPSLEQSIHKSPHREPELVNAASPGDPRNT